ncbi:hypothetical protein Tco_0058340 [Tanacetum coccineum]
MTKASRSDHKAMTYTKPLQIRQDEEQIEEAKTSSVKSRSPQHWSKITSNQSTLNIEGRLPKIDEKTPFELKGQFLKELRDNTFSGSDNDDANEHIEEDLS